MTGLHHLMKYKELMFGVITIVTRVTVLLVFACVRSSTTRVYTVGLSRKVHICLGKCPKVVIPGVYWMFFDVLKRQMCSQGNISCNGQCNQSDGVYIVFRSYDTFVLYEFMSLIRTIYACLHSNMFTFLSRHIYSTCNWQHWSHFCYYIVPVLFILCLY